MGKEADYPSVIGWVGEQLAFTTSEAIERSLVPRPSFPREGPSSIDIHGLKLTLSDVPSVSDRPDVWKWWPGLSLKDIFDNSHHRLPGLLQIFTLMEHLPIELRRAIIRHVDTPSLKNLRLASKVSLCPYQIAVFLLESSEPRSFTETYMSLGSLAIQLPSSLLQFRN